jgi:hypothetical protein
MREKSKKTQNQPLTRSSSDLSAAHTKIGAGQTRSGLEKSHEETVMNGSRL